MSPVRSVTSRLASLPGLRWLLAPALLALLALVHAALWYLVTDRIEAGLAAWQAQAEQAGWQVQQGGHSRSGWPWAATIRISDVTIARGSGSVPIRWTSERLDVSWVPEDRGAITVAPVGRQAATVGAAPANAFQADQATLRLPLEGDAPATLHLRHLVVVGERFGLEAGTLHLQLAPLALTLQGEGIEISPRLPPPFDGPLSLSGRLLSSAPLPGATDPAVAAARWRDMDGHLDARDVSLVLGPLHLTGEANMQLDAALQPAGRATLHVEGAPAVVDAATRAGFITPSAASAVRAVVTVLTLGAAGGPITVPVVVAGSVMTVAQFPLVRLPALDWTASR